ncbi:hypothetical protein MMC17_006920 [Xylographa soralifera]|nr:hypothetical protein [Xylographa soralifera]
MKRQPANIGYERLPDQGQDFNNNDGPETLALGHDTTLENCPWDSHVAPVTPADRRNSNMDNNWSMQRLPRPASKARTGRKGVDLSSSTLVTQHEYPKSAPTTPSGGKLDLIERRQSLGTPVPLAKVVGLGSGNTSTKTGPDPKQHVLSPGGQRPGPSGSISSPLVTLSNPFVVYDLASGREMPKKRTRNMSPEAKYHAACVRRLPGGACGSCKLSKRKCNHVLEEDKADSSLDPESADGRPKDEGSASSRWKTCL